MKILVTGATGFLGYWVVDRLIQEGHQVKVLVRKTSSLGELSKFSLEQSFGDVTDLESLVEATKNVDCVFHLAGLIAYKRADRPAMEKVNIDGTRNVIEACKRNNVKKLVYLSSVVAIGSSFDGVPLNERSVYNIGHLNLGYFETKHKAELLVRDAALHGELDAVMINPSTIYGGGDAKKGSRGAQLKVARGKMPFYTAGGVNVVAVEDVIDCLMACWKKGRAGERYIVAGENILIKDLFSKIADAAGVKPPKIFLPTPAVKILGAAGDLLEKVGKKGPLNSETAWTSTLYHWFDSTKAQREFNLKFKPADFGIEASVRYMKDNGYL
jgi:dihydroflavonol-4-reductase